MLDESRRTPSDSRATRPARFRCSATKVAAGPLLIRRAIGCRLASMVKKPRAITRTDEQLAEIVTSRGSSAEDGLTARDAFVELYERYARRLLPLLARRVSRSDLDDLLQEIWLKIWLHPPGGHEHGRFRRWLFRVARNTSIDRLRKRPLVPFDEDDDMADAHSVQPDEWLIDQERKAALERCLEQLPGNLAEIVRLA